MTATVSQLGEFGLINRIRTWTRGTVAPSLLRGIGDDCATIRTSGRTLFKTDAVVENVHFRRVWATPREIGWKALAANVSDIVAAGGTPTAALISLELPGSTPVTWVKALYAGFTACARKYKFSIAGGNISASTHIAIHISMLGNAPRRLIGRSGAHPGDLVVVTGALGGSMAGLKCLERGIRSPEAKRAIAAHLNPEPILAAGLILGAHASAMCDISDGLIQDAGHIAEESGVQLVIVPGAVPVHPVARALAVRLKSDVQDLALTSGEEYKLLATVSRKRYGAVLREFRRAGFPVAAIGEVRRGHGVAVHGRRVKAARGWDHFKKSR